MATSTPLMPPPRGNSDAVVQGTNDDAQISKLYAACWWPTHSNTSHRSCARLGYFHDPFIQYFVRKHTQRSPLINRGTCAAARHHHAAPCPGYYSRTAGLRLLLTQFLSQFQRQCQVLVMGAGYDTTWFQLQVPEKAIRELHALVCHRSRACNQRASSRLTLPTSRAARSQPSRPPLNSVRPWTTVHPSTPVRTNE